MTNSDLHDRKLTVHEVAKMTEVSEDTVRRWLATGQLKGYRISRKSGWRTSEADLLAFIARRQSALQSA